MASGYGSFSAFSIDDDEEDDGELLKAISQIDRDFSNDDESLALSLQWEEISNSQGGGKNCNHDDDEEAKSTTFIIENWDSLAEQDGFEVTKSPGKPKYDESLSSSLALSDPQWELVDPTPNIHTLFMEFDRRFFYSALGSVEIGWSKRMTTCAGICYYSGRRSGYCRIGLSEPLLKLRARKELVETLIHEMIHAYLFVTNNNKDHDGHGPEFHKHMFRINKEAGLSISVYHTFHDEVAHYKRHWWRCDGPCRNRPPYHGYVKRASNRAPSKNDFWWADHQRTCGGNYVKVKEPEEYTEKQQKKKNKQAAAASSSQTSTNSKTAKPKHGTVPSKDIRGFLSGSSSPSSSSQLVKPSQKGPLEKKPNSGKKEIINQPFFSSQPTERLSSPSPLPPTTSLTQKNSSSSFVPQKSPPPSSSSQETNSSSGDVVLNSGAILRKIIGENRRIRDEKSGQKTAVESKPPTPKNVVIVVPDDSSCSNSGAKTSPVTVLTAESSVACPVCGIHVSETSINLHLDSCLSC